MKKLALALSLLALAAPLDAFAAAGESSFTPKSLRVPLRGVRLDGAGGSATLYQCADGGDCLVDMADDAALDALFASAVEVRPGTYDRVAFDHCIPGASGYSAFVAGDVMLAGTAYHTVAGPDAFLASDGSLTDYAPLPFSGCSSTVPLPAPLTVAKGDELELGAFFTLSNIAWGALGPNGIGGCASTGAQSVCSGYPIPVAFVGAVSPTLETYFVTEDLADTEAAKAGGQMLLLCDADGVPFGGFSRRLYSETSVLPHVLYDTPVKSVARNADATYVVKTWGGGPAGAPPAEYYVKFPSFELATHEGQLTGPDFVPVPYRAVKQ